MQWLKELRYFPDFVKISHSVFALPFALGALLLAEKKVPSLRLLGLVVSAVVCARFSAMAFNRIVDAKFDAENPRTSMRHLPSGMISFGTAWLIVGAGVGLFVWISFSINWLAGCLSPVALLFVLGYSLTKRFTRYSHFVLGAALGLAPLGAWVAARNDLRNPVPWLLAGAVVTWVAGFDMIYALQDRKFDQENKLHSMAVVLGEKGVLRLVPLLHLMMVILLVAVGVLSGLKMFYFMGLLLVLGSLLWEQWLIRHLNEANLQKAFLQANALASFGFLGAVIVDTMVGR